MIDLKILAIDTSGKVASVAVTDGEKLLWEKSVYTKLTHSQVILPMVKQALEETGLTYADLDCAAIAKGPGSYTGLRIGVAAVKGMCFGCESLKSAGVSTLLSLAYNCIGFEGRIISVMRARPKIVYAGEFQCKNGVVTRISADRVCPEEEVFSGEFTEKTMWTPCRRSMRTPPWPWVRLRWRRSSGCPYPLQRAALPQRWCWAWAAPLARPWP